MNTLIPTIGCGEKIELQIVEVKIDNRFENVIPKFVINIEILTKFHKLQCFLILIGSDCYGVDLMRNFDTSGFGIGASSDPCSNTYKGSGRNSEIETRIAFQEILENAYNIRVSLSLHSIGNELKNDNYKNNLKFFLSG